MRERDCSGLAIARKSPSSDRALTVGFLRQFRSLVAQLARARDRRTIVLISDGFGIEPGAKPSLLDAYFPFASHCFVPGLVNCPRSGLMNSARMADEFEPILQLARGATSPLIRSIRGACTASRPSTHRCRGLRKCGRGSGTRREKQRRGRRQYPGRDRGGDGRHGLSRQQQPAGRTGARVRRWPRLLHACLCSGECELRREVPRDYGSGARLEGGGEGQTRLLGPPSNPASRGWSGSCRWSPP